MTETELCKHGHPWTPENTYIIPGTGARVCRRCKHAREKACLGGKAELRRLKREREQRKLERRRRKKEEIIQRFMATKEPGATPQLAAWVARKRREKIGLPLRLVDREQISEQMEDL